MYKSLIAFLLAVAALLSSGVLPPEEQLPGTDPSAPVETAPPTEPTGPHSHNFVREVVSATCLEEGYTVYTCTCGEFYKGEYTSISDHSYSEWMTVTEATCIAEGHESRVCSVCGNEESRHVAAGAHKYETIVTPPTCQNQGYSTSTCVNCDNEYQHDFTKPVDHSYGEWIPVNETTCTMGGMETRSCQWCDKTETRYVEANGHEYVAVVTAPTCTSNGYTTYTCKCGDQYVSDHVEKTTHHYNVIEIKPTCTEEGYNLYICTDCDKQYIGEHVDATGHSFTNYIDNNDATCTDPGTKTAKCDNCDAKNTVKKESGSAPHNYNKQVVKATCTTDGYTVYTCSCGASYKSDYVKATGHSFTKYVFNNDATCTDPGTKTAKCDYCDATDTVKNNGSTSKHNYNTEVVKPSCLSGGYTLYTCSCGHSYKADFTPATGHSFTKYISNNDATCTSPGTKTAKCDNCKVTNTIIDTESPYKHNYTAKVIAATCTDLGYTQYTCACGDSYNDNFVNPLGHSYTKYTSNNDATCTEDGTKTAKCDRCNASHTTIDRGSAKGHSYSKKIKKPTCVAKGYTTYTCACGDSYKADYTNATGHSFTKYTSNNDATCEKDGTKTAKCDRCNTTDTVADVGSAKGHTYTKKVTAPTCDQKGYTTYTCVCGDSYKADYKDAKGHTYTSTKTEPTCSAKGYTTYKCACGYSYKDDYVDAKGHNWGRWIVIKSATYDEEGKEERTCKTCKIAETRSIPKKERPISNEDADEIAALAVKYINELRNKQGSCTASVMEGCTEYAEYRSMQMAEDGEISHDPEDKKEAANALKYGLYIDPSQYGLPGDPYYTVVGMEAVGTAYGDTIEEVARCIADGVKESTSHWNYVGADSNAYISVGVCMKDDTWYVCIIVAKVNLDENPSGA